MSGAIAINKITSKLGYASNPALSEALWVKCRAHLESRSLDETIEHIESAVGGSLDTLERGDLYDALGEVLVGRGWPLNGDPESISKKFSESLVKALHDIGFRGQERATEGPSA